MNSIVITGTIIDKKESTTSWGKPGWELVLKTPAVKQGDVDYLFKTVVVKNENNDKLEVEDKVVIDGSVEINTTEDAGGYKQKKAVIQAKKIEHLNIKVVLDQMPF